MMNNNIYARSYLPNYASNFNQSNMYEQNMMDQIDGQINQLVSMRNQIKNNSQQQNNHQQPTAINQTFQLAPNGGNGMKFVDSIENVKKETVFFDTPFFSKDLSVLWLKSASGDIKAYELNEIIEKDEKDLQIEFLQSKLNELEGRINNEQSYTNVDETEISTNTKTTDGATREPIKESKSTSISRVSTSKKK